MADKSAIERAVLLAQVRPPPLWGWDPLPGMHLLV